MAGSLSDFSALTSIVAAASIRTVLPPGYVAGFLLLSPARCRLLYYHTEQF